MPATLTMIIDESRNQTKTLLGIETAGVGMVATRFEFLAAAIKLKPY